MEVIVVRHGRPEIERRAEGIADLEQVARHLARRLAFGGPVPADADLDARPQLTAATPAPDDFEERFDTDEISIEPISSSDIALALPDEDIEAYRGAEDP